MLIVVSAKNAATSDAALSAVMVTAGAVLAELAPRKFVSPD